MGEERFVALKAFVGNGVLQFPGFVTARGDERFDIEREFQCPKLATELGPLLIFFFQPAWLTELIEQLILYSK